MFRLAIDRSKAGSQAAQAIRVDLQRIASVAKAMARELKKAKRTPFQDPSWPSWPKFYIRHGKRDTTSEASCSHWAEDTLRPNRSQLLSRSSMAMLGAHRSRKGFFVGCGFGQCGGFARQAGSTRCEPWVEDACL